jgi:hypothetical protein
MQPNENPPTSCQAKGCEQSAINNVADNSTKLRWLDRKRAIRRAICFISAKNSTDDYHLLANHPDAPIK